MPRQFARVCHSINMKWGVMESHVAVIALHNCGKSYSQIFKLLKQLKISRLFIYRAIKCYEDLWRVEDGSVRTPEKFEGSSCYQSNAGVDLPKSTLETEDHVLSAEHIDPINVATYQGRSTHESALPLKRTHPCSCFEGDPKGKSRAFPVAC